MPIGAAAKAVGDREQRHRTIASDPRRVGGCGQRDVHSPGGAASHGQFHDHQAAGRDLVVRGQCGSRTGADAALLSRGRTVCCQRPRHVLEHALAQANCTTPLSLCALDAASLRTVPTPATTPFPANDHAWYRLRKIVTYPYDLPVCREDRRRCRIWLPTQEDRVHTVFWTPRFAVVYFLAALAAFVLFTAIGSNMAIVAPLILTLIGLGIAVMIRHGKTRR